MPGAVIIPIAVFHLCVPGNEEAALYSYVSLCCFCLYYSTLQHLLRFLTTACIFSIIDPNFLISLGVDHRLRTKLTSDERVVFIYYFSF